MEINSVNSKYEDEQSLNSTLQRKLKEHQVCLCGMEETQILFGKALACTFAHISGSAAATESSETD